MPAAQFPSYHGWIDEVRLSNVVRYSGAFTRAQRAVRRRREHRRALPLRRGQREHAHRQLGGRRRSEQRRAPLRRRRRRGRSGRPTPVRRGRADDRAADADQRRSAAPTSITHAGDSRLFITEQGGTIRIWDGTQLLATPFLTVTPIASGGEQGLLSVAFHPQYAQNGFFYVYYTDAAGNADDRALPRLGQSERRRSRPAAPCCSPFRTRSGQPQRRPAAVRSRRLPLRRHRRRRRRLRRHRLGLQRPAPQPAARQAAAPRRRPERRHARRSTASRPPIRSSAPAIRSTRSGPRACAIRGASASTA